MLLKNSFSKALAASIILAAVLMSSGCGTSAQILPDGIKAMPGANPSHATATAAPKESEPKVITTIDSPWLDMKELVDFSDAIVVGKFISYSESSLYPQRESEVPGADAYAGQGFTDEQIEDLIMKRRDELTQPVTLSKINITKVLRGDFEIGSDIEVMEGSISSPERVFTNSHSPYLQDVKSPEVVLFLRKDPQQDNYSLSHSQTALFSKTEDQVALEVLKPYGKHSDVAFSEFKEFAKEYFAIKTMAELEKAIRIAAK